MARTDFQIQEDNNRQRVKGLDALIESYANEEWKKELNKAEVAILQSPILSKLVFASPSGGISLYNWVMSSRDNNRAEVKANFIDRRCEEMSKEIMIKLRSIGINNTDDFSSLVK